MKDMIKANDSVEKLNQTKTEEIDLMKTGSNGLVSQITTISKIRITKPLHYSDAFAGIKLSDESLNIIDKKICELYIGK